MKKNSDKVLFLLLVILTVVFVGGIAITYLIKPTPPEILTFDECVDAGYPVLESYPRQCLVSGGDSFIEDINDQEKKDDLIRLFSPQINEIIAGPFILRGEARGFWFFEADFPVLIIDGLGNILAQLPAMAEDNWMTTDFVPFSAEVEFLPPETKNGWIILKRSNPSDLPENDDELRIPIKFSLGK